MNKGNKLYEGKAKIIYETNNKNLVIQPVQYIQANKIGFCEGSIIKYATRWREKGGIRDLEKIKHFCDILIEGEKAEQEIIDNRTRS